MVQRLASDYLPSEFYLVERPAQYLQSNDGYTARIWAKIFHGLGPDLLAGVHDFELENVTDERDLIGTQGPVRLRLQLDLKDAGDWQDVLTCLPEIAECRTAHNESEQKRPVWIDEAREEEVPDFVYGGDEELEKERRADTHIDWVTGCSWTYDGETAESGEALITWVDQYGRVVRQDRAADVACDGVLIDMHNDTAIRWWNEAWEGSDYEDGN